MLNLPDDDDLTYVFECVYTKFTHSIESGVWHTVEREALAASTTNSIPICMNHRVAVMQDAIARGVPVPKTTLVYMAPELRYTMPN